MSDAITQAVIEKACRCDLAISIRHGGIFLDKIGQGTRETIMCAYPNELARVVAYIDHMDMGYSAGYQKGYHDFNDEKEAKSNG